MVDVLGIFAHPDDGEMSVAGSFLRWREQGARIGVVDLTAGDKGTRGNPYQRMQEASRASSLLGLQVRICLGWEDAFFEPTRQALEELTDLIRRYRPLIVVTNAQEDRHPDHGRAATLVERAVFLAGLPKIVTRYPAFRPRRCLFAIQDRWRMPNLVVDITSYWKKKLEVVRSYASQFFMGENDPEPPTYLTREDFWQAFEARHKEYGKLIGVPYGEGFELKPPVVAVSDYWMLVT
ncbi:MAG: bacillithiol biosynthesis deacetylase BshB1 [Bacteroidia bacterium]